MDGEGRPHGESEDRKVRWNRVDTWGHSLKQRDSSANSSQEEPGWILQGLTLARAVAGMKLEQKPCGFQKEQKRSWR